MTTPTRAIAAFAALTKNVNRVAAQASARLAKLTKEIKAAKPKARKPKAKAKTTRKAAPKAARKAAPKYAWTAIDNRQTQQPAAPRATTPRIKRTAVAEPAQIAEAKPKMAPISRGVRVGGRRASGDRASGDRAGGESASGDRAGGESAGGESAPPRSVKLAGLAERLEDSELVMLSAAMNRPDRCLLPIASRFHDRHHELVASLRRLGLVAEVPAQRHSPKWEHGGDEGGWGTTLVLTGKAFDALGIERPPDLRRGQMKEKPP